MVPQLLLGDTEMRPELDDRLEVLLDRREQLARELAEVEDALWRKKMAVEGSSAPADEVLRIREACTRMRWSYSWAVKHWRELGGFKDVDGGLKIRAGVLARHEPGES